MKKRNLSFTLISLAWTSLWLLVQVVLLYRHHTSALSRTMGRQPWWSSLADAQHAALPISLFVACTLLLYVLFAWVNADAFRLLLAPRIVARRTQVVALIGQLFLATFALHLLNAWWYPFSISGDLLALTLIRSSGQIIAITLGIAAVVYFTLWLVRRLRLVRVAHKHHRFRRGFNWATAACLGATTAIFASHALINSDAMAGDSPDGRPDVIVIGMDSLRPDHLRRFGAPFSVTPNLDSLLEGSAVLRDTLTTQAHTFPATVSILTGQWPNHNGARGNLFPPALINANHSFAHRFRAAGYRTVIGMDETRFANVDERYGFDEVVGPGIGLPDFIMSFAADTVLVNLLANTAIGRWMFPHLHGNRAVDHVYRPESFSDRLDAALSPQDTRPLLLYVHFCAGHWPYRSESPYAGDRYASLLTGDYADGKAHYLRALAEADGQVGHLINTLRLKGRLDNAVLVTLSDHGEDFGMSKDATVDDEGNAPTELFNGHGGSAFRSPQVQVLLAWRRYGDTPFAPNMIDAPASLVDIAPTLTELAGLPTPANSYDGISMAGRIAGQPQPELRDRIRYVESSYFPEALNKSVINPGEVLDEVADMYEFTTDGRVQVRIDTIDEHIAHRQRAAYSGPWIAALRESPDSPAILIDRRNRHWWNAKAAPAEAPSAPLFAALCRHWQTDRAIDMQCRRH